MTKHGIDCFSSILPGQPEQLRALGYSFFARYYRRAPLEGGKGNALSRGEARRLFDAGFWSLAIYQNSSDRASYFTHANARADAEAALAAAQHHGQPPDTTIYFAVDCNPGRADLPAIHAYFGLLKDRLWQSGYYLGVYGSGLVCKSLSDEGLVHRTWLANAKGWFGYEAWHPHADVIQTTRPFILPFGLEVDADATQDPARAGMWRPDMGKDRSGPIPNPTPSQRALLSRITDAILRIFGRNPGGPNG